MTGRFSVLLIAFASLMAAAETPWEPGKVVAVEEVSIPAKAADPSCLAVPKGAAPPARCRASNLRARQFWRVTIDVGSRRFVVRPYRAQNLLNTLNQDGTVFVNPNVTAASLVEVAVTSSKAVRLKTEGGQEMPALVDSQALVASTEAPLPVAAGPVTPSDSKVVLLENDDFHDLEIQECKPQNIGDGVALYSFPGAASPVRAASKMPAFVVLAGNGNVELSRLQVGKGTRELAVARNRSASPVPIVVTQVSATLRKFTVKDPLPPGEYVVLLENSNRGFLFAVP